MPSGGRQGLWFYLGENLLGLRHRVALLHTDMSSLYSAVLPLTRPGPNAAAQGLCERFMSILW